VRILREADRDANRRRKVVIECSCGKEFITRLGDTKSGNTRSCGCLKSAPFSITSTTQANNRRPREGGN